VQRHRSVGVARKIGRPLSIACLRLCAGSIDLVNDIPDVDPKLTFAHLAPVFKTIREYCMTRNSSDEARDEYSRVYSKLTDEKLHRLFVSTIPQSTMSIVLPLLYGSKPSWNDIHNEARVVPRDQFNCSGTYIHVGRREDDSPFDTGAYIGSGAGESEDTNFGVSGLVGIIRRIWVQHGSPTYRKAQLEKAKRRGRRNRHYSMYREADTPNQHFFAALNLVPREVTREVLGQASAVGDQDQALRELNERTAVVRIFETTWLFSLGLYRFECDLQTAMKAVYLSPSHGIRQLNLSVGLEGGFSSWQALSIARKEGARKAALTFGKGLRLPDGSLGNLNHYMDVVLGPEKAKIVSMR
jgi:hypothetical protein